MDNILVSIIVPVYNMSSKVEKSVETLIKQTYQHIEIILVDDGSKDDSLAVCQALSKKDNRIRVFHTENRGAGPARNHGIEKASGKYLYFPDADDLLEPTAIEQMVSAIEDSEADVLVFGYQAIDVKGNVTSIKKCENAVVNGADARKDYEKYFYMGSPFGIQGAPWNKLFKRDIIQKHKVEYPPLRRHQDDAFIARYVTHCDKIRFLDAVLYTYYENDLRITWDKYPITYIDAVIALYEDRKKTILTWCEDDVKIRSIILNEYICNSIKGLELSFSKKYGFKNKKERLDWMKENISKCKLKDITCPDMTSKYQQTIIKNIKNNKFNSMYKMMKFKVSCEKSGLISAIRRIAK